MCKNKTDNHKKNMLGLKEIWERINKRNFFIMLGVVFGVIVCASLIFYFYKYKITEPAVLPAPQRDNQPWTEEEIHEALYKKTEEKNVKPMAPEEIDQALNKKTENPEEIKKLSPEEIEPTLYKKAE